MIEWNPRYVCYAVAHGRSPEGQLEHDKEAHPGGHMGKFMIWMRERWDEFALLHPDLVVRDRNWTSAERRAWLVTCYAAEFDAWLKEKCHGS